VVGRHGDISGRPIFRKDFGKARGARWQ